MAGPPPTSHSLDGASPDGKGLSGPGLPCCGRTHEKGTMPEDAYGHAGA